MRLLQESLRRYLLKAIHRCPQFIPAEIEADGVTTSSLVLDPWTVFLDKSIIPSTGGEDVSFLAIEETLKE